jgi:hypothetical protein
MRRCHGIRRLRPPVQREVREPMPAAFDWPQRKHATPRKTGSVGHSPIRDCPAADRGSPAASSSGGVIADARRVNYCDDLATAHQVARIRGS